MGKILKMLFITVISYSCIQSAEKCEHPVGSRHAQLSSTETQVLKPHSPQVVTFDLQDSIRCIGHEPGHGKLTIQEEGDYFILLAPQVGGPPGFADFWLRKNGTDVKNTNIRLTRTDADQKDVIVGQAVVALKEGDYIEVMGNTDTEGVQLEAIYPKGGPLIPSIIFSLFKLK